MSENTRKSTRAPKRSLLDLNLDFSQQEGRCNNLNVVIGESSNNT